MNILNSHDSFLKQNSFAQTDLGARKAALEYALAQGLPTKKNEDWHYTSTKLLAEKSLDYTLPELAHQELKAIQERLAPDFINVVFVNGVLNKTLSSNFPDALKVTELCSVTEYEDSLDALNAAYATNSYHLELLSETSVDKPVSLTFAATENFKGIIAPRIELKIGKRSSLRFVESYLAVGDSEVFVNSSVKVKLDESAKLIYVRLQNDALTSLNMGRTDFSLASYAALESLSMTLGAQWSRHTLNVSMQGENADAKIFGVYCASGTQHMDHTTSIDHVVGLCNTEQLYKGILDGKSRTVFNGKVLIQKNAQKANSAQLNNNLLLSSTAEADSKPNLEIYADDVKAAHGSTVGQLNREELFYLQSRAIPKARAIEMLSSGFVSELIYRISDSSLHGWLQGELNQSFSRLQVKP